MFAGHYIIPGAMPYDGYHDLHIPHNPPLYPTLSRVPKTTFSCNGKAPGYYADVEAACQVISFHSLRSYNYIQGRIKNVGTSWLKQLWGSLSRIIIIYHLFDLLTK